MLICKDEARIPVTSNSNSVSIGVIFLTSEIHASDTVWGGGGVSTYILEPFGSQFAKPPFQFLNQGTVVVRCQ